MATVAVVPSLIVTVAEPTDGPLAVWNVVAVAPPDVGSVTVHTEPVRIDGIVTLPPVGENVSASSYVVVVPSTQLTATTKSALANSAPAPATTLVIASEPTSNVFVTATVVVPPVRITTVDAGEYVVDVASNASVSLTSHVAPTGRSETTWVPSAATVNVGSTIVTGSPSNEHPTCIGNGCTTGGSGSLPANALLTVSVSSNHVSMTVNVAVSGPSTRSRGGVSERAYGGSTDSYSTVVAVPPAAWANEHSARCGRPVIVWLPPVGGNVTTPPANGGGNGRLRPSKLQATWTAMSRREYSPAPATCTSTTTSVTANVFVIVTSLNPAASRTVCGGAGTVASPSPVAGSITCTRYRSAGRRAWRWHQARGCRSRRAPSCRRACTSIAVGTVRRSTPVTRHRSPPW
jgi:hypothetical protein